MTVFAQLNIVSKNLCVVIESCRRRDVLDRFPFEMDLPCQDS